MELQLTNRVAGGVGRNGAEPVRRRSKLKGRCEGAWWRPFKPRDVGRTMLAAERYDRLHKRRGERNGPIGAVGLEVLREMLRLVDYRTGRLEPALTTLMARTRRSRDAVVRALAALRRAGFVDWLRRYVATGAGGPGPRVQQTSNAYRLHLPPAAERLLGRAGQDAPIPDDHFHRVAAGHQARADMLASADVGERNGVLFGGRLGAAFTRWETRLERESARRSESRQKDLESGTEGGVGLVARQVFP